MNELTLIKKTNFESKKISIYGENGKPERWYTRKEVGAALEYSDPQKAIDNLHQRNKEELDQFSVTLTVRATDGKEYETAFYNTKGVYVICVLSQQPKAKDFLKFIYDQMIAAIPQRQLPQSFNENGFGPEVRPETPLLLPLDLADHYINQMTELNYQQLISLIREAGRCARDCKKTMKYAKYQCIKDNETKKSISSSLECMHAFLGMAYRVIGMR